MVRVGAEPHVLVFEHAHDGGVDVGESGVRDHDAQAREVTGDRGDRIGMGVRNAGSAERPHVDHDDRAKVLAQRVQGVERRGVGRERRAKPSWFEMHADEAEPHAALDLVHGVSASRCVDTGQRDEAIGVPGAHVVQVIVGDRYAGHAPPGEHAEHTPLAHPRRAFVERGRRTVGGGRRLELVAPQRGRPVVPPQRGVCSCGGRIELGRHHAETEIDDGVRAHVSRMPPSTRTISPVMYDDNGDAKKSTTRAMSSGAPSRPSGLRAA